MIIEKIINVSDGDDGDEDDYKSRCNNRKDNGE